MKHTFKQDADKEFIKPIKSIMMIVNFIKVHLIQIAIVVVAVAIVIIKSMESEFMNETKYIHFISLLESFPRFLANINHFHFYLDSN